MKDLGKLLLLLALTLLFLYGMIFHAGDATIFVSPPEAVAEGFVREIETKRYDRALPYLTEELSQKIKASDLKAYETKLEDRTGGIEDVSGEPGPIHGDKATAYAAITTSKGDTLKIPYSMKREQGAWSIDRLNTK